jgi:hypothetical protein
MKNTALRWRNSRIIVHHFCSHFDLVLHAGFDAAQPIKWEEKGKIGRRGPTAVSCLRSRCGLPPPLADRRLRPEMVAMWRNLLGGGGVAPPVAHEPVPWV